MLADTAEFGAILGSIQGDRQLPKLPYTPFAPIQYIQEDIVSVPSTGTIFYDDSNIAGRDDSCEFLNAEDISQTHVPLRSLRDSSAFVVAEAIDAVETLEGVPWHLGKLILSHLRAKNANRWVGPAGSSYTLSPHASFVYCLYITFHRL